MQGGIADLSLRELAAAIGTSHRMLLYHFGSREGLLAAVTIAVEEAERATLREVGAVSADDARRFWAHYSDPGLWPQERLFFELYAHALRGRPGTEGFLEHVVTGWLEPLTAAIVQGGTDPRTAPAAARLSMAVTRGLLLDLLATRDIKAVTAAFELFLLLVAQNASGIDAHGPAQGGADDDKGDDDDRDERDRQAHDREDLRHGDTELMLDERYKPQEEEIPEK